MNKIPAQAIPQVDLTDDIIYRELYSSSKIYTRKTKGFYQRLRRFSGIPLLLAFFLTPWLSIDGRPAVYFDLVAQKFHVFWTTFWPQDGILLAWLLIIAALFLFTATVWAGRVWCGFSCPQTVWTLMFIWVEDKCEGDRNQRIKLDASKWTTEKLLRKSAKHLGWVAISAITAFTFVAYFYGITDLIADTFTLEAPIEAYFWLALFLVMTYLNAGYLREQVCKHMCPYSRFQSAMYDSDTLLVTYDQARGENRGPRKSKQDYQADGLGDCIDCSWCVQVCPADIDIRDGLQAECIDCGLCIDACDTVMDKMGYAKGLISFASENGEFSPLKKLLRPRMLAYSLVLVVMLGVFINHTRERIPLQVDVIRDRGVHMYRVRGANVENVYTVKLNNMSNQPDTFVLSISSNKNYHLMGRKKISLEGGEVFTVPIRVSAAVDDFNISKNPIIITATSSSSTEVTADQASWFYAPVPDK